MKVRFELSESDYYRGGMAVNFSHNNLSSRSLYELTLLLHNRGIRSVNLSHLGNMKAINAEGQKRAAKN
jgi:hypothetical protein